jgi:hypothetical protein
MIIHTLPPQSVSGILWTLAITDGARIIPVWQRPGQQDWRYAADFSGCVPPVVFAPLLDPATLIGFARNVETLIAAGKVTQ